jgi:hypothetical protein
MMKSATTSRACGASEKRNARRWRPSAASTQRFPPKVMFGFGRRSPPPHIKTSLVDYLEQPQSVTGLHIDEALIGNRAIKICSKTDKIQEIDSCRSCLEAIKYQTGPAQRMS